MTVSDAEIKRYKELRNACPIDCVAERNALSRKIADAYIQQAAARDYCLPSDEDLHDCNRQHHLYGEGP